MSIRISYSKILMLLLVMMIHPSLANADREVKHVFELFTSQGCYSCPPAEKLLGRIVDQKDEILALEYHVDYWDTLVYGAAGKWKDPFSSPEYSQRQRDYNRLSLTGRKGVYTPQMIVDGSHAFVGSKSMQAQSQISKDSRLILQTSALISPGGDLTVRVDGDHGSTADVWLVNFDKQHVTDVPSGENMGKKLKNSNVVRKMQSLGQWQGEPLIIESPMEPLSENQGCAVIVQEFNASKNRISGPILGAAKCQPS